MSALFAYLATVTQTLKQINHHSWHLTVTKYHLVVLSLCYTTPSFDIPLSLSFDSERIFRRSIPNQPLQNISPINKAHTYIVDYTCCRGFQSSLRLALSWGQRLCLLADKEQLGAFFSSEYSTHHHQKPPSSTRNHLNLVTLILNVQNRHHAAVRCFA